jgi:transcriptional regulator of acetoin/glycerol metabolism
VKWSAPWAPSPTSRPLSSPTNGSPSSRHKPRAVAPFSSWWGKRGHAEIFRRLRLAAQSDVTVLLSGESGTGKSPRARRGTSPSG